MDDEAVRAYADRDAFLARMLAEATVEQVRDVVIPVYRIILDPSLSESQRADRLAVLVASMRKPVSA